MSDLLRAAPFLAQQRQTPKGSFQPGGPTLTPGGHSAERHDAVHPLARIRGFGAQKESKPSSFSPYVHIPHILRTTLIVGGLKRHRYQDSVHGSIPPYITHIHQPPSYLWAETPQAEIKLGHCTANVCRANGNHEYNPPRAAIAEHCLWQEVLH